ncbi:MAG: insulinase family protein [Puia sp.]
MEVKADVPLDALYKAFHVGSRTDKSYYAMDLIGELLGGGGSSRLFQTLVKEKKTVQQCGMLSFRLLRSGTVINRRKTD